LTQALQTSADFANEPAAVVGTLRRDHGGLDRFLLSLGELYARGLRVDWAPVIAGGRKVALPTYAFQRERYWPEPDAFTPSGDAKSLGLSSAEHPLLGASVMLADGEGALFSRCRTSRGCRDTSSTAMRSCPAPVSSSWR
jgi:acyl transferase domain-containing protein